jgi:hypothetical protein
MEFLSGKLYSYRTYPLSVVMSARPIFKKNTPSSDWIGELEQGDMFICLGSEDDPMIFGTKVVKILTANENAICGYIFYSGYSSDEDIFRLES